MTTNRAIDRADELRPNTIDRATKAAWVLELEGRIYGELLMNSVTPPEGEPPREFPRDADAELSVPAPWDRVYELWLCAQIDYANADMNEYNNSVMMFEDAYGQFARSFRRKNMPLGASKYELW